MGFVLWYNWGLQDFGGDKFCHLRLGFWGYVTRRHGENGGLLKQSNGSHGGADGTKSDGAYLPILLAYIQSVHLQIIIKNLYAIPPSLFVPSAPLWHCVYLRPLRDSVCLLYKTFSLSLHITEEPQFERSLFVTPSFSMNWFATFLYMPSIG